MSTNCKPGDLAIVKGLVRCASFNGMVVDVLCYVQPGQTWKSPSGFTHANDSALGLAAKSCGSTFQAPGHFDPTYGLFALGSLIPIRDQPGEDETLQWAGLPNKQGVPA